MSFFLFFQFNDGREVYKWVCQKDFKVQFVDQIQAEEEANGHDLGEKQGS